MTNICIISSWTENLNIIKLCQRLSLQHNVVLDSMFWPHQDKEIESTKTRVIKIMDYMSTQWATHFILSPSIELKLLKTNSTFKIQDSKFIILPLFTNYLNYCLQHSLVGKIGFVWWYADVSQIESLFENIADEYQPTEIQKNIKKFQQPLAKRTKDTSMRWYFARSFSPRNMMINKTIKFDLRYFKDANVDTIIPLDYSYFNFQKTITSFFNPKKQKFHTRDILQTLFSNIVEQQSLSTYTSTQITIYHTWSLHLISQDKKWERLLSQWQQKTIEYTHITIS